MVPATTRSVVCTSAKEKQMVTTAKVPPMTISSDGRSTNEAAEPPRAMATASKAEAGGEAEHRRHVEAQRRCQRLRQPCSAG